MTHRQALVISAMGLTMACSPTHPGDDGAESVASSKDDDESEGGDESGSAPSESESSGGETPSDTSDDDDDDPCARDGSLQPKRLVRLTFNQPLNTIGQLFGDGLAAQVAYDIDIEGATVRTYPPLANPREGSVDTDTQFQAGDNLAQAVAEHVHEHFTELSGCEAPVTDDCARAYVLRTAEQAFRRPLTSEDHTGLLGVYDAVLGEGGSILEAAQYTVYATLLSPHFTYRTEFGDDAEAPGRLTPIELAS